jgi:hypothetical protein
MLSSLLSPYGLLSLYLMPHRTANYLWFRNDMFELSHRLIGIYKTSNATRSTCANLAPPPERKADTKFQVYQSITTLCSLLFPNTHHLRVNLRFRRHKFPLHKPHCQQLELLVLYFCNGVLSVNLEKLICIPMI